MARTHKPKGKEKQMSNPASQNPKPLSNLGSLRTLGAPWPERKVSRHRATGSVLTAEARLSLILQSLGVRRPYRLGRSPSCPSLHISSSSKASLSPGASQPSPGKSLAARFQLSLLWGAPRSRDHRSQGNGGRVAHVPSGPFPTRAGLWGQGRREVSVQPRTYALDVSW